MSKSKRIVLALLVPPAVQILYVVIGSLYYRNDTCGGDSLQFFVVLCLSLVLCTAVLGNSTFKRFWTVHLFSSFSTALLFSLLTLVIAVIEGTGGYFWLGVTMITMLFVASFLASLPATYLTYRYLRSLDYESP